MSDGPAWESASARIRRRDAIEAAKEADRDAETRRVVRPWLVCLVLIPLGLIVFAVYGALQEAGHMHELAHRGTTAEATVVARHTHYASRSGTHYSLDYDIHYHRAGRSQVWHERGHSVDESHYDAVRPGSRLSVTFLPDHPSQNQLTDRVRDLDLPLVPLLGVPVFILAMVGTVALALRFARGGAGGLLLGSAAASLLIAIGSVELVSMAVRWRVG